MRTKADSAMPTYLGYYYDVRPRRPGWSWSAFDLDQVTPVGLGEARTKVAAERAASACISNHRENAAYCERTTVAKSD